MVPGLKFYRRVVELQNEFHKDIRYSNSIQTNGVLIDDDWIDFFLSMDSRSVFQLMGQRPFTTNSAWINAETVPSTQFSRPFNA